MASFGENLRRERELRGIALKDIAEATKIGVRFLHAIEEERLDILPGGMFPRAFVGQYAAFVGLDVERTVADFMRLYGARWAESPSPHSPRSRERWGPTTFLAVAAGLLGLGLLLTGRPQSRTRLAELPPPTAGAAHTAVTGAPDLSDAVGVAIELRAEQECWVEAAIDGQSILNRVLTVGETTTLEATSQIVLSVGNAGGLSLSVNGQPGLPLGRNGEVRRNIRITRENAASFLKTLVTVASSQSS
jgi:cytoskeleton protein RodZ